MQRGKSSFAPNIYTKENLSPQIFVDQCYDS
jgi:hypothetical protein